MSGGKGRVVMVAEGRGRQLERPRCWEREIMGRVKYWRRGIM